MTRKIREFHRPADLAEAMALLRRVDVSTAALALGPRAPDEPLAAVEAVIDLRRLGLDTLTESGDGVVHIGAQTTLHQLAESSLLQSLATGLLSQAALLAAGSAMRHAATVGGALRYALQAAAGTERDGPPELLVALLVLDAEVVLGGDGSEPTVMALSDYLASGGNTAQAGLVTELRFARPTAAARGALARVARTPRDQGIVAAAALIEGPAIRIAVAPGSTAPHRLQQVERILAEQGVSDASVAAAARAVEAAVTPQGDYRGSAEYRRAMAGVLVGRALAQAAGQGAR